MSKNFNPTTTDYNLKEVSRLIAYIGQYTIDSEQMPICSGEIPTIINQLIQR